MFFIFFTLEPSYSNSPAVDDGFGVASVAVVVSVVEGVAPFIVGREPGADSE